MAKEVKLEEIEVEKDTLFIKLLKFGAEHSENGTTYHACSNWARTKLEGPVDEMVLKSLWDECFQPVNTTQSNSHTMNSHLKAEYYFRLIEFEELQQAYKASTSANENSRKAMGIATIAIIASIVIGLLQILTSIIIHSEQMDMTRQHAQATPTPAENQPVHAAEPHNP